MTRYKLQIQESCPLKLAAKRCLLQRRQWQRCSGQYNSSVQYSVAQMAAPETGSPMQESPFAPLALLHHFCFHLIYHSALCYKLHYFRRFSCPELTDLLMFKQKSRAWTEQFLYSAHFNVGKARIVVGHYAVCHLQTNVGGSCTQRRSSSFYSTTLLPDTFHQDSEDFNIVQVLMIHILF